LEFKSILIANLLCCGFLLTYFYMNNWFSIAENSIHIGIKAVPGASKTEITGIRGNHLCIRIAAAPEDGKANACLCEFLAKTLGCPKRDVAIINGEKSRLKTVEVPMACEESLKGLIG